MVHNFAFCFQLENELWNPCHNYIRQHGNKSNRFKLIDDHRLLVKNKWARWKPAKFDLFSDTVINWWMLKTNNSTEIGQKKWRRMNWTDKQYEKAENSNQIQFSPPTNASLKGQRTHPLDNCMTLPTQLLHERAFFSIQGNSRRLIGVYCVCI